MKYKVFYRMHIILMMLIIIIISNGCQKAETETENERTEIADFSSQEEEDWKELEKHMTLFYENSEEKQRFKKGNFWHRRKFEEKLMQSRLGTLRKFLKNYPESKHHFDALKYYFTYLPEPRFIDFDISRKKKEVLNHKTEIIDGKPNLFQSYHKFRTLPYNNRKIDNWLKEGDSLINVFIKSNAPEDQKARIEVERLGRNLRMAIKYYRYLHLSKNEEEAEFWFLFDRYFWNSLISQMDNLIFKYPQYSRWPAVVDQIISLITESHLSPQLSIYYWEHFRDIVDKPHLFMESQVMEEIHHKAKENIKAIKTVKGFDERKPLQMESIALDGKKIDLEDYRGKVVLLDFWSIRCAPCIQEMPHVRALYDKYKAQGFEVIGISAEGDNDRERVLDIMKEQKVNWPQLLDRGANATVSYHSLYKINVLPTVWLLNKDGVIVDKHARGSRLEPLIKKYLELD